VQQLRQRPHPHEFTMYYDAWFRHRASALPRPDSRGFLLAACPAALAARNSRGACARGGRSHATAPWSV